MFKEAFRAQKALAQNFEIAGYKPSEQIWRDVRKGINRDLQARQLRPNVAVPPRRNIITYLDVMRKETGSILQAMQSCLHDGSWTSSGGSFLLAERLGYDFKAMIAENLGCGGHFHFLEVGGGWAGFRSQSESTQNIAGLCKYFSAWAGKKLHFHFTNLTKWHNDLPRGVTEHPYITGATLLLVEEQGCRPLTVDVIYSQAAVYFEKDIEIFLENAHCLLKMGGILIFNYPKENDNKLPNKASMLGFRLLDRVDLGGMNGIVVAYEKVGSSVISLCGSGVILPAMRDRVAEKGVL